MEPTEPLVRRTVASAGWRFVAQAVSGLVLFGQAVFLARVLPVEVFGIYALAFSVVGWSQALGTFGFGEALIHRCPETEDERRAAAVHLTLTTAFSLVWFAVLAACALVFVTGPLQTALIVLGASGLLANLTTTPRMVLSRRVQHRRLAFLQLSSAFIATAVAVVLALLGAELWTLLGIDIVVAVWFAIGLWCWRPVCRPSFALARSEARYFLGFGLRLSAGRMLQRTVDHFDKLWTGVVLGEVALGFYSRARLFAGYPHKLLGVPMAAVAGGTFAELKGRRESLSGMFFDVVALLLRAGFWVGGVLVLAAPEIVLVVLGERWLPMLGAFRLMMVFTLLEPINMTVARLFHGVGRPGVVVQTRLVQLVVLAAAVTSLGSLFRIEGVAVALGISQLVGIGSMLVRSRRFVDISLIRLFGPPTVALAVAFAAGSYGASFAGQDVGPVVGLGVKGIGLSLAYIVTLVLIERRYLLTLAGRLRVGLVSADAAPPFMGS